MSRTLSVLAILLVLSLSSVAQSDWEKFEAMFPDTVLTDTLNLNFEFTEQTFHKYMVDSMYRLPFILGEKFLPDSVSDCHVPMWKCQYNGHHFYFLVGTVNNWNWGYLLVRPVSSHQFICCEEVYVSEPADSGERWQYSTMYLQEVQVRLLKRAFHQTNQRWYRHCHESIEEETNTVFEWNEEQGHFTPVESTHSSQSYFFGCDD